MGKYIAKLTGETDAHTVSREFDHEANAISWLRGPGLAEFDDQEARGEIFDASGRLVWTKPHLRTSDHAERESRRDAERFLARLNLAPKKRC